MKYRQPTVPFSLRICNISCNISKYRKRIVVPNLWLWVNFFHITPSFYWNSYGWREQADQEKLGDQLRRDNSSPTHSAYRFSPPFLHIESKFFLKKFVSNYVCACPSLCGYMHECTCLHKPTECIRYLVLGVTDSCGLPEMGTWKMNLGFAQE